MNASAEDIKLYLEFLAVNAHKFGPVYIMKEIRDLGKSEGFYAKYGNWGDLENFCANTGDEKDCKLYPLITSIYEDMTGSVEYSSLLCAHLALSPMTEEMAKSVEAPKQSPKKGFVGRCLGLFRS